MRAAEFSSGFPRRQPTSLVASEHFDGRRMMDSSRSTEQPMHVN
jgi:hypothetical protein